MEMRQSSFGAGSLSWVQRRGRFSLTLVLLAALTAFTFILWGPGYGKSDSAFLENDSGLSNANPVSETVPTKSATTKPESAKKPGAPAAKTISFDVEEFELEGPFDGTALAKKCRETEWQEGLYFDCSNNSGGIGNMRSFLLTCVRYAIDAGAGLIQPTIRKRSESHLADLFTSHMPLGYMFDETFFLETMHEYCPQMSIAKDADSIPNADSKFFKPDVNARAMANHLDNDGHGFDANRWAGTFREDFDWWAANIYGHVPSKELPVVLSWEWAFFFDWPIWLDGPEFANTFGRLLKIRPDVAKLASKVVQSLHELGSANVTTLSDAPPRLLDYIGVHLRVEDDCLDWWPKEKDQIEAYITQSDKRQLHSKVVYIATGSQTGLEHWQSSASEHLKSDSYSKEMILKGDDLTELKALQWDQQGLVDYLVLLRSRYFLGMFQSSFSQNIASRRHLLKDGIHTLIWRGYYDDYSFLHGLRHAYNSNSTKECQGPD